MDKHHRGATRGVREKGLAGGRIDEIAALSRTPSKADDLLPLRSKEGL